MKKYSIILYLVLLTLGLSSCLKDDMIDDQKYGMINIGGTKNAYDGMYAIGAGSTIQRYTAAGVPTANDALNGSLVGNPDIALASIDPTTVEITYLNWADNGGRVAGIDRLQAVIDPATNQVTLKSLTNITLKNIAGRDNKYDPATKTFILNFDWNQTTAKRAVSLILSYKTAR